MKTLTSEALVHIIDDEPAIRDSLSWLFKTRNVPTQCWESGESFLAHWTPELTGCLLLDIRMDGMSGLELFDALLKRGATQPVIFLSGHGDLPMAVASLKQGAADFIEKPFNDNDLVDRVLNVLQQYEHDKEQREQHLEWATKISSLSNREKQVLELALKGMLNKQIADELDITMRTVEVHRARALEKTGAKNLLELAHLLRNEDLLSTDAPQA